MEMIKIMHSFLYSVTYIRYKYRIFAMTSFSYLYDVTKLERKDLHTSYIH